MVRLSRIAVSASLAAWSLGAQSARDQARLQDLNFLAAQLPKMHANFFFQLNPADYSNAAGQLGAQVSTLTDAQFYVGLAQLVAMAGDAHTFVGLFGSAAARAGFRTFPLEFRWLDDGVFATGAAASYSRALGAQLVRVGDFPIDEAVRRLSTMIPHENDQWLHYMAQQYLKGQQVLQGLNLLPAAASSPLTFRDRAGVEFTLNVGTEAAAILPATSPAQASLPQYLQSAGVNYWSTYSAANRLLYFKYNQCADMPGNPFSSFSMALLHTLDTNPVDTFVFDFRGNTGGDGGLIAPLGLGFAQRLPALAANPRFGVFVAIDKGTFSSGMDDAMQFKQPIPPELGLPPGADVGKLVRILGEPTGGKPEHYGEVKPFTLPASQLVGQYSTQFFPQPDGIPPGPAFAPDIAVPLLSADYFAWHDPVLAAILARWPGTPPAAPAAPGDVVTVNAASFRVEHGLAAGSFAAAFGNLPAAPDEVQVNGQPGRVIGASAAQVNFVVPPSTKTGPAAISIRAAGREIAQGHATITAAGPGLFVLQLQPADPSQPGAVLNQDSSVNGPSATAGAGSIIQIFATGYGPLDTSGAAPVQVMIAGEPAEVLYSAPTPQLPALWQINARVPATARGQVSLYLVAGSTASNAVTVLVR
jgi:uncharacterized protein (TIGR03437 family)